MADSCQLFAAQSCRGLPWTCRAHLMRNINYQTKFPWLGHAGHAILVAKHDAALLQIQPVGRNRHFTGHIRSRLCVQVTTTRLTTADEHKVIHSSCDSCGESTRCTCSRTSKACASRLVMAVVVSKTHVGRGRVLDAGDSC